MLDVNIGRAARGHNINSEHRRHILLAGGRRPGTSRLIAA
jgi:hypothetical protein